MAYPSLAKPPTPQTVTCRILIFPILDFRIYGSKAKGTDVQDSDVDVMIVLEDHWPTIESEIDDLIFDINTKYDCLISALFFSPKELEFGSLSLS